MRHIAIAIALDMYEAAESYFKQAVDLLLDMHAEIMQIVDCRHITNSQ